MFTGNARRGTEYNTISPTVDFSAMDDIHELEDGHYNNRYQLNVKRCRSRHPNTAGYGYHRRRLRINQELRRSNRSASLCTNAGKHNIVSSSVHRNLLVSILASFVPLLLLQGN